MMYRGNFQINNNGSPFRSVGGVILMVVMLVGLFMLARFVFRMLYFLSPLMIIATAIIDHRVIVNYAKWLIDLLRRNALVGVGAILLSIVGFPVLSAGLLLRALFNRKVRQMEQAQRQQEADEYVDFEELVDDKPIELPPLEKQNKTKPQEPRYDQFFG